MVYDCIERRFKPIRYLKGGSKMRYDAREQLWDTMEIKGVVGYFCDLRIDRDSIPDDFNFYELADGDSDGIPCRYSTSILVNFYGTFITTGKLELDRYGHSYINSEKEWEITTRNGKHLKFEDILKMERIEGKE